MKVVQSRLSRTEYAVLAGYARSRKTTIEDAMKEAIRKFTLKEDVDPERPIFKIFPLTRKKSRHEDASERHDVYLYGENE